MALMRLVRVKKYWLQVLKSDFGLEVYLMENVFKNNIKYYIDNNIQWIKMNSYI